MRCSPWLPRASFLLLGATLGVIGCAAPPVPAAQPPVAAPKVTARPAKPSAVQTGRLRQDADTACTVEAQQATSEEPDELLAAEAQRHLHDVCMAQRGF